MIFLALPEPPSSNRFWRHVVIRGSARVLLSAEAREYKQTVYGLWVRSRQRPILGEFALSMQWYRGRKSGDLDNRIKQLLDALKGLAFTDDAELVRLEAERYESVTSDAHVNVTITPAGIRQEALSL